MIVLQKGQEELTKLLAQHKKCLIDFNTTWCGPCKMLAPELQKLEDAHSEWTVISVDAEKFPEIFKQVGADAVPTVCIIVNGKPMNEVITGFRPVAELEKIIAKY